MNALQIGCLLNLVVAACAVASEKPDRRTGCPAEFPAGTSCYSGLGPHAAPYLIAMPSKWNGTLFLQNRGATPVAMNTASALGFAWRLIPDGYAIAASGYRARTERESVVVSESAEDTENLRAIFANAFGTPTRTIALGFSYGALVTARLLELYGVDDRGTLNYDAAFHWCGSGGGSRRAHYPRLDLRVVYQYYCHNHPREDEEPYDLFLGLPPEGSMTVDDLSDRVNDCTGFRLSPEERTETQRQNLANILNVIRIPESQVDQSGRIYSTLLTHMMFATFSFQYLVQERLVGLNPYPNRDVMYTGSTDDLALNAGVLRYDSDPEAVSWLSTDGDPTGHVAAPVLTLHAVDDGISFVEHETAYQETFEQAGTSDYLLQTFTTSGSHCAFSLAERMTDLYAVLDWLDTGHKPTPQYIADSCPYFSQHFGGECRFDPNYQPNALDSRIYPRNP